jgi:hypothetical protein
MRVSLFVRCALIALPLAAQAAPESAPLAQAQSLVGKSCAKMFTESGFAIPGYTVPKGALPVILKDGVIRPMEKGGARFAFLTTMGDDAATCRIADVVALPDARHADAFFQCHERDALVEGFGLRLSGHKEIVGWWTIANGKLKQMTDTKGVICLEPETGD